MITQAEISKWFTYHPPQGNQAERYVKLREAAASLVATIVDLTPEGPDQTAAVRKVREAVMTANAAVACDEVQA